ncbi:MAG: hypothetical protein ABTA16_08315 [Niallia sp.]
MDYDKLLAYLVGIATFFNQLTGGLKNVHDMKNKQKKKRPTPGKKKGRK